LNNNYHIQKLENAWTPELFDLADQFLSQEKSSNLIQVKKGLYTFEFRTFDNLEVEVLLTGQKVSKTTCDCASFKKSKKCGHILAVLILVRRKLLKEKIKKQKKQPKKPSSLNIYNILADAPPEGLRLFAREYARQDDAFSILLKTRFIRTISLENDHQKYELLLNQIIKIGSNGKVQLHRSKRKTLSLVIESLLLHVDEALVDRQYRDAFDILSALLHKMHIVIDRNEQYATYFHKEVIAIYGKLKTFLSEQIPPEMKQLTFNLSLDLANRSNYQILDLYFNVITIISPIGKEIDAIEKLYDLVELKIEKVSDQKTLWLSAAALLFHANEANKEARHFFHRVEQVPFAGMIEHLVSRQEYQIVIWLTELIDISIYRDRSKIRIQQQILEAAKSVGDFEKVQHYALELMTAKKDISYYQMLLSDSSIPSGIVEMKAEQKILEKLEGDQQTRMFAEYYIASQKQTQLLKILIQKNDIDFFIRYDTHVLPGLKHELTEAYLNLIENHLVHYAGNANVELIQKWKNHFEILNLSNEIEEVLSKLQEAHPERQILYNQIKKR
jgi:hypothetical protein